MTATDRWISECSQCWAQFRDSPQQAGVCPHCGHENEYGTTD